MAPNIIELLGEHKMYYEPFCGSMAVLLVKPKSYHETVCDLHKDLTNLATVLSILDTAVELYDRLGRTLFDESLVIKSRDILKNNIEDFSPVERAYHYFVSSWCCRNGVSGTLRDSFGLAVRWTPTGGTPTLRFRSATESIPAWHERLRNVVILNRSAWEVIPKIPDQDGVVVYCDPPYIKESRGGASKYRHDFDGIDHRKLARELCRFEKTRVVVSYYEHPELAGLYPADKWSHIPCHQTKNLHVQNRRGSTRGTAPELLIVNEVAG